MLMNEKTNIIQKFKEVGRTEVSSEETSELGSTIEDVFKSYPSQWFTQKDFVTLLKRWNGVINNHLRRLLKDGTIIRQGSHRKYYYQLAPKKA